MWHPSGARSQKSGMSLLRSPPYSDSTTELPECTGINNHPINLVDAKQPSYALPSHPLPLRTLFICKIDGSLWLCVWGLNILTIKNWYPLLLIKTLPSWSKCQFRQKEVYFLGHVMFSHVTLTFRFLSNLYRRFIQGFKWIAAPLTSMLKTTGSSDLAPKELETDEVIGGGSRADKIVVDLSKLSKVRKLSKIWKTSKAWKVAKIIGSEEHLPKHRPFVN